MNKQSHRHKSAQETKRIESLNSQVEESSGISVEHSRIPSLSDEALLEFGKDLIKESVTQSVEFHKTMLGLTATFATLMASAFGIVVYGSSDQQINGFHRLFLLIAVIFMLLSSVCFALGYYPRDAKIRLQVLNSISETRSKLLRARRLWALAGMFFFIVSIVVVLVGMFFNP